MAGVHYLGLYLLFLGICIGEYADWDTDPKWQIICPALYAKVFTSNTPRGNLSGGVYTIQHGVSEMKSCVADCCIAQQCNVALMHNSSCYHVECIDSKMCTPLYRPELADDSPPSMVLVKPVKSNETWSELLDEIIDNAK